MIDTSLAISPETASHNNSDSDSLDTADSKDDHDGKSELQCLQKKKTLDEAWLQHLTSALGTVSAARDTQ